MRNKSWKNEDTNSLKNISLLLIIIFTLTSLFIKTKVDYNITQKSFNFPKKHGLPFYFVSASDGTNVVKVSKYVCK